MFHEEKCLPKKVNNISSSQCFVIDENCSPISNFDALADDMLLAVADNVDFLQAKERKQKRQIKVPLTQGFQTIEQYIKDDASLNESLELIENEVESMFHETEETTRVENSHKSIVTQILEDFCSSPPSPSSVALEERLKLKEPSPTFIFKHRPMRTYNRKRLQLVEEIVATNEQDDDCLSTSSGLSVQEDLTQLEVANESSVLNESHKVFENLLNLSAYFSQQIDNSVEKPSMELNIVENDSKINIVEVKPEIKQLNFDSSSEKLAEELRLKLSQHLIDVEKATNDLSPTASDILNAILKLRQQMPMNWERVRSRAQIDQDLLGLSNENLELETSNTVPTIAETQIVNTTKCEVIEELQIFSDDDCDDFFVNINTQEILKNNVVKLEQQSAKICDFETAACKTKDISEDEKTKALNSLLAELPELDMNIYNMSLNTDSLPSFKTASSKNIKISEAAKKKAARILEELPELSEAENLEKVTDIGFEASTSGKLPSFKTASSKNIQISEDAKKKAAGILAELPDLNKAECLEKETDISFEPSTSANFPVFKTASSKNIQISEDAKRKAAGILEELPDLTKAECFEKETDISFEPSTSANFPAFKTASRKNIQISEDAKKKASSILAELPDLTEAENVEKVTEIGFQADSRKSVKITKSATAKILAVINDNGTESDSSEKDYYNMETSSKVAVEETANISGIQFSEWPQANMEAEPLPMLQMSQLDLRNDGPNSTSNVVNTKVIARKNLLSLSMRRKNKSNNINSSCEILKEKFEFDNKSQQAHLEDAETPMKFLSQPNTISTPDTTLKCSSQKDLTATPNMLVEPMSSTPLSVVNSPQTPNMHNKSLNKTKRNKSNSKTPSVKQRVERLRMYGEPPPISPIPQITPQGVNNCRPSGLRRSKKK